MADDLSNLGKEITKAVERILSTKELRELKTTVQDTINNAIDTTTQSIKSINIQIKPPHVTPTQAQERHPHPGRVMRERGRDFSKAPYNLAIGLGLSGAIVLGIAFLIAEVSCIVSGLSLYRLILTGLPLGIPMVACVVLTGWGFRRKGKIQRLERYRRMIDGKTYCPIHKLAMATEKPESFVVKDLRHMISNGMLSEGYFDEKEQTLILDYETYQQYLSAQRTARSLAEKQQRKQELSYDDPKSQAILDLEEAGRFILQIRRINDTLPDPGITRQLDDLEQVTQKIFDYVKQHPEKLPQIRKFLRYYLPTTLKLMEAYRELENHGDYGKVESTKNEIKTALGNINKAFENLFSNLLQNDLMNLSADISALESMLAQEGLSDNGFN